MAKAKSPKNKKKTNSSMKKRIKVSATWKFIHGESCRSHLLVRKKWQRRDKKWKLISAADYKTVKDLLPYA